MNTSSKRDLPQSSDAKERTNKTHPEDDEKVREVTVTEFYRARIEKEIDEVMQLREDKHQLKMYALELERIIDTHGKREDEKDCYIRKMEQYLPDASYVVREGGVSVTGTVVGLAKEDGHLVRYIRLSLSGSILREDAFNRYAKKRIHAHKQREKRKSVQKYLSVIDRDEDGIPWTEAGIRMSSMVARCMSNTARTKRGPRNTQK